MDMAIGGKLAEYTISLIRRQFGYFIDSSTNLKAQFVKLEDLKSSDTARRNGEEIEDNFQHWLKQVDEVVAEANKFHEHEKAGCSNLCSRHHLVRRPHIWRKLYLKLHQMENLTEFLTILTYLSQSLHLQEAMKLCLQEHQSCMKIMKALKHENMYLIGVYGMGVWERPSLSKNCWNLSVNLIDCE
ncbi:hypothetical protein QN277_002428 [Acacia crassicarpa]|uniref:Uncharacterized protein n=1 Tax=Acacia crassicarpa TaxID=499986 RepID=A0AAE1N9I2_9FABA|nr:hypothetical protein QN277_002428 [Acacia crassicarpa]